MREAYATLARWADWGPSFRAPPRLVRELGGGLTNRSFLIETADAQFVLRLASPHATLFGIDRQREYKILTDAAAAGIAPPVHYHAVDDGILISSYLDGRPYAPQSPTAATDALVALAQRIHALPTKLPVEDYYAHAERYRQRLEAAAVTLPPAVIALGERIRAEQACGGDQPDRIRVCHRDLNRANIIDRGGRLYVIDWEYATRGATAFDFAALIAEWDLPCAHVCRAAGLEREVLDHALRLYRYTCELWHRLSDTTARSGSEREGR